MNSLEAVAVPLMLQTEPSGVKPLILRAIRLETHDNGVYIDRMNPCQIFVRGCREDLTKNTVAAVKTNKILLWRSEFIRLSVLTSRCCKLKRVTSYTSVS